MKLRKDFCQREGQLISIWTVMRPLKGLATLRNTTLQCIPTQIQLKSSHQYKLWWVIAFLVNLQNKCLNPSIAALIVLNVWRKEQEKTYKLLKEGIKLDLDFQVVTLRTDSKKWNTILKKKSNYLMHKRDLIQSRSATKM
jgi:hypothetical protein